MSEASSRPTKPQNYKTILFLQDHSPLLSELVGQRSVQLLDDAARGQWWVHAAQVRGHHRVGKGTPQRQAGTLRPPGRLLLQEGVGLVHRGHGYTLII